MTLCAFLVEHNLPFNIMPHLVEIVKNVGKSPEVLKKLRCGRQKATMITRNVLGAERKLALIEYMKHNPFSIIVDESTDRSCIKQLAIVSRIVKDHFEPEDAFLALIEVEDGCAEGLYNSIVRFFEINDVPYKKQLVGLAADGANVMMGPNESVCSKLKVDCPDLVHLKCVSHSFHLVASHASNKLPDYLETLLRDVHNYFSSSPKRTFEFKAFQELWSLKPNKILHPSCTRWLALNECIKVFITNYTPLVGFFKVEDKINSVSSAKRISEKLDDPLTKVYFQFLEYILPFFVNINLEMQSEDIKIHLIYARVSTFYKTLLENFMDSDYIRKTDVQNIDFKDKKYNLALNNIYLGGKIEAFLIDNNGTLDESQINELRTNCLSFYLEAARQTLRKFPFKELTFLRNLEVIMPENMHKYKSIIPLALNFPNVIDKQDFNLLDVEFRSIRNIEIERNLNINDYWNKICSMRKGDDSLQYPLMAKLINYIFCLPHSSATVERIFSAININKTKVRNRLKTETLEGILHTKRLFKQNACFELNPNKIHFAKFNQLMYDHKNEDADSD